MGKGKEIINYKGISFTEDMAVGLVYLTDELLDDKDKLEKKMRDNFTEDYGDDIDNAIKGPGSPL